jgi:hypothetical protein
MDEWEALLEDVAQEHLEHTDGGGRGLGPRRHRPESPAKVNVSIREAQPRQRSSSSRHGKAKPTGLSCCRPILIQHVRNASLRIPQLSVLVGLWHARCPSCPDNASMHQVGGCT